MAFTRVCTFCLEPIRECICDTTEPSPTWDVPPYDCRTCQDTSFVCTRHPGRPAGCFCCNGPAELAEGDEILCEHGACHCGAPSPCPSCASPVADDVRDL